MTKLTALVFLSFVFVLQAHADDLSHPLLDDKGAWPLDTAATAQLQLFKGMSHVYRVNGAKGDCWNLSVRSPDFAPMIVLAQGKGSVAFGAYVGPEQTDEFGRIYTMAGTKDRKWVTAMSVCADADGGLAFVIGRGWVWGTTLDADGHGITLHAERAGGLGGEYSIVGEKY